MKIKKLLKSKEIGEDDEKSFEKNVQSITDDHIKIVDGKVSLKEKRNNGQYKMNPSIM